MRIILFIMRIVLFSCMKVRVGYYSVLLSEDINISKVLKRLPGLVGPGPYQYFRQEGHRPPMTPAISGLRWFQLAQCASLHVRMRSHQLLLAKLHQTDPGGHENMIQSHKMTKSNTVQLEEHIMFTVLDNLQLWVSNLLCILRAASSHQPATLPEQCTWVGSDPPPTLRPIIVWARVNKRPDNLHRIKQWPVIPGVFSAPEGEGSLEVHINTFAREAPEQEVFQGMALMLSKKLLTISFSKLGRTTCWT